MREIEKLQQLTSEQSSLYITLTGFVYFQNLQIRQELLDV